MSKIDYQVLREAAVAIETVATPQKLLAFRMKVTPQVVLALLDERDALNERLAELEADLAGLAEDHQKATESIKQADAAVKLAHEKFSALAAKINVINELMEVAEQVNKLAQEETEKLAHERNTLAAENAGLKSDQVRIFNSGYQRGHEATVEGYYVDIHQNDMTTYHEDIVAEILEEQTPATDAFLAEVRASAIPDEATERDLFEEWVMEKIFISKTTLEGLRTDDGYRNSTLSGTDYNGMWSQWKAIRAAQLRKEAAQ